MAAILAFCVLPFWGWMLYDCTKREINRTEWCLAIFVLNVVGALLYFGMRWLPRHVPAMNYRVKRWAYRERLRQLTIEAKHVGKAAQFFRLGEAYVEVGQPDKALAAYQQALEVDPRHCKALWGAGSLLAQKKEWSQAQPLLETLLQLSPDFKYGEASLAYGQVLNEVDPVAAKQHLAQHLKTWHHPEAYLLLAHLCQVQNETDQARELLETMIAKVKAAPAFYYRKHKHFVVKAQKLLKTMG